ncbi:diguanylate cyclase [Clostridiaceae bacterium HSG29]|nr:diguanylate cyclase [Clostridiaceae bacterium HSG29]
MKKVVEEKTKELKNSKLELEEQNDKLEEATKMLKESEKRFEALSKYSTDVIARFDSEFRHLYINPAAYKITNIHAEEFIGKTYLELGFPEKLVKKWENAIRIVFETAKPYETEFEINGHYFHWSLMPEFSNNDKNMKTYVSGVISSARDITERKINEQEIEYKSYHDELTGLNNRTYFNEKLDEYNKEYNLPLGIILADLNGLKITNDTLGHIKGDILLKKVAEILKTFNKYRSLIARIGGDEFIMLVPNKNEAEIREICDNIKKMCLESEKDPIRPSVALGYAVKEKNIDKFPVLFKKAEDNMYENKMYESESTNNSILISLEAMLRETTNETFEHSIRLKNNAVKIGEELNLSNEELKTLSLLADLHDLGKIGVPQKILQKPGALSESEWKKIKRHPEIGFKIANSYPKLNRIAEGILSHHERWDGKGYPRGLKGEEIPFLARIITIVDAYDAMITTRPYKKQMTKEEAIKELINCSGTQFDSDLVKIFIEKVLK